MSSDKVGMVIYGPPNTNIEYKIRQPPPAYFKQPTQYEQPEIITRNLYTGTNKMVIHEVTVVSQPEPGSECDDSGVFSTLVFAVFTTFCCNPILGIPAIVLASAAFGDIKRSCRRGLLTASVVLSGLAIVSGIIMGIVLIRLQLKANGLV